MGRMQALTEIEAREIQEIAERRAALALPEEFWLASDHGTRDAEAQARWYLLTDRIAERIAALSNDARVELLALTWVGIGDPDDDWQLALGHATLNDNAGTARFLANKASLAVYIEKGLHMLAEA